MLHRHALFGSLLRNVPAFRSVAEQQIHLRRCNQTAHHPVQLSGLLPKLQHIPQHPDAPAGHRKLPQHGQGCPHGIRACIVAIQDYSFVVNLLDILPHAVRLVSTQSPGNLLRLHACQHTDTEGSSPIHHIMFPDAGQGHRGNGTLPAQIKAGASVFRHDTLRPAIRSCILDSIGIHRTGQGGFQRDQIGIIPIHHQGRIRRHAIQDLQLRPANSFLGFQLGNVGKANVGNHADAGCSRLGQPGNLSEI